MSYFVEFECRVGNPVYAITKEWGKGKGSAKVPKMVFGEVSEIYILEDEKPRYKIRGIGIFKKVYPKRTDAEKELSRILAGGEREDG